MAFIIPDKTIKQMQAQAAAAGMPYATILKQHLYDLQGLEEVLSSEQLQAKQALSEIPPNSPGFKEASAKLADLTGKLANCQAEIAAYQQEIQQHP